MDPTELGWKWNLAIGAIPFVLGGLIYIIALWALPGIQELDKELSNIKVPVSVHVIIERE